MKISRKELINLVENTTIHGPSRILKSRLIIIKLIWTFFFLLSLFFCSYTIFDSIRSYFEYDYTTSFDYFTEIPAEFPKVTICNLNTFQTDFAIKHIKSYLKNFSSNPNLNYDSKRFFLFNNIRSIFNHSTLKSLSYPFKETIIRCTFMNKNCSEIDFEWRFDSTFGNCYQFNSGKNSTGDKILIRKLTATGDTYGLHLELFLGDVDLMPEILQTYGVRLMINNVTIIPVPHEGLNLESGTETNIFVNRLFHQRLSLPYNDCIENLTSLDAYDSHLFRTIVEKNLTYRQSDCFYLCYQKQNSDKCNCQINNFLLVTNKPICSNLSEIECSNDVWNSFLNSDISGDCSSVCPLECSSNFLSITATQSSYPTKAYAKLLMNHTNIKSKINRSITYEELKQLVLSVNVYYEQLGYIYIGQKPKTGIFDLVSNIGGLLGLFLGMSLLSIIEFVEIIIEIFFIIRNFFKNN